MRNPSVRKTSTPAIFWVMVEVCVFTALLGLAMHALGGLQIANGDVNAPGAEGVRDYMLRYMGEVFVGGALGPALGQPSALSSASSSALLLLSAVNTAIVDLITIQFLMSRDREMPTIFQRLNKWGVPEPRHVARDDRADAARHHGQRHGRSGRSLRGRRCRRDRDESRRDRDRSETLDQDVGTRP